MLNQTKNKFIRRYIYILKIDNYGKKSSFYGNRIIYYTGQTNNLSFRLIQHLNGINSKFLNKHFPNAKKVPVYIECIEGTEYDAIFIEHKIKKLSKEAKEKLIYSEKNLLVGYKPISHLILKNPQNLNEEIIIKL